VDAVAAVVDQVFGGFGEIRRHEFQKGQSDGRGGGRCADALGDRLERLGPARVAGAMREKQESALHRYRTNQLKAANDISM
jgi:hypothetical protein